MKLEGGLCETLFFIMVLLEFSKLMHLIKSKIYYFVSSEKKLNKASKNKVRTDKKIRNYATGIYSLVLFLTNNS